MTRATLLETPDRDRSGPVRGRGGAVLLESRPDEPDVDQADPPAAAELDAEPLELGEVGVEVAAALEVADLDPRDHAAAALAMRLAGEVDDALPGDKLLPQLARQLAAVLEALELTPAARRRPGEPDHAGAAGDGEVSPLERVRRRSAERLRAVGE